VDVATNGTLAPNTVVNNIVANSTSVCDPDLSNNTPIATSVVGAYANVYLEKTGPLFGEIGQEIVYELSYGNNGNSDAQNTMIVDTIDYPNVTYVSATQPTGTAPSMGCYLSGTSVVVCDADGIAGGSGVLLPVGAT
jgi:uncharacterized repeat protein (TIGR01451 family)